MGMLFLFLAQTYAMHSTSYQRRHSREDERVHLVHADRLEADQYRFPGAQILFGHVTLTHSGMRLKCDSAVLYQGSNSFMAVGHVRLTQGDTLSLTGDSLYYDGTGQLAQVFSHVVMRHRTLTLYTEHFNYDRIAQRGYYNDGGKLVDNGATLTSLLGDYFTSQRRAEFYREVQLVSKQCDTLVTDTLHYDTRSKWAHAIGPSNIYSGDSHIYTEDGTYNSETGEAMLCYSKGHRYRPQLFNKRRKLVGDSIVYDKKTQVAQAFRNIRFDDPDSKCTLIGHYGYYDDSRGEAMATDRALAKEYSNPEDTLFMHADTLRLYSYNLKTDTAYRVMHAYPHARAFRSDVQAVSDSLVFHSARRLLSLYRDPIVWSDNKQVLGEEINVYCNDSTVDSIYVERQALLAEKIADDKYNQVAAQTLRAYYDGGELREGQAERNVQIVNYPMEKDSTYLYQNFLTTARMRLFMENKKVKRIWAGPASDGKVYPIGTAPAQHTRLGGFAWFDYIRPLSKDDLMQWRGKHDGSQLKDKPRRQAPRQILPSPPSEGEAYDTSTP